MLAQSVYFFLFVIRAQDWLTTFLNEDEILNYFICMKSFEKTDLWV
jgi:hypothetical protein